MLCSKSDKNTDIYINWYIGYRDAHWYIEDTWLGFSVRNIAQ